MPTRTGALTRAIAIDALTHVMTRHIHADIALDKLFEHHQELRPLDRAFIFEIVYGSLRWLSKMDWIMSHMMERSFTSLDPRVANALRVGTYQIYYMDRVPDRAAVSETVEALRLVGASNAVSFVNAILRRVAKKGEYFPKPDKDQFPVDFLAMHFAHPKWMIERWIKTVPMERLEFLCLANNQAPKQTLRVIRKNPVPEDLDLATWLLREFSITSSWRPLANCLHVESYPPFQRCAAFQAGAYVVQDEAAQLVSSLIRPTPEDTILDACAAPGTKAILMWDEGATPENMVVCDSSRKRMELLHSNFARVGLKNCEVLHGNVSDLVANRKFTKIILDAPCSSLGVIRRHPEIKWLRTLGDVQRNAQEQKRLLDSLSSAVADNGELIYIVCSNEREETIDQIDSFLERNKNFEILHPGTRLHDYYRRYVTRNGELLVLPGNPDNIDGFYAVILKKIR